MNKIPKILFVVRDNAGCGFFRCFQPAAFLNRSGLAEAKAVLVNPTEEDILSSDLVVMQEMGSSNGSNIARFCIEHKIPYITEFDDFIHHVSPHNLSGFPAWNPGTLYVHRAMEVAKSGLGITVSTPQLAREYFPYNPNIFVVPNYLDKDRWDNPIVKRKDGKLRIGWMGGNAHADDLAMVTGVLEKIVKENKGKVVFETMGMTKQELGGVFSSMKGFNDTCPSCGYEGEVHHYPGEALENYPLTLASKGWDIAIAPVINNSFGNCKSDLKIKEYAAAGIPIVASPIVPYKEAVDNGASVLFANSFEEWYDCLTGLLTNGEKRDEMVRANKDWISKKWIQDNIGSIFEVYSQFIQLGEKVLGKGVSKV